MAGGKPANRGVDENKRIAEAIGVGLCPDPGSPERAWKPTPTRAPAPTVVFCGKSDTVRCQRGEGDAEAAAAWLA